MYSDNLYEIYGFAKPFKNDAGTTDLLSLADFSAGIIQEILQSEVARWMGTESAFLTKVNLAFVQQDDGDWAVGSVNIQAKI
jgi:hypothetical protein